MISLGPLPLTVAILALAWAVGALVGRWTSPPTDNGRLPIASVLFDMLLMGLLSARLAFIVVWWPLYAEDPWAMLRPGDGGYVIWVGVVIGLAWGVYRSFREPVLRRPLAWGAMASALVWISLTHMASWHHERTISLPGGEWMDVQGQLVVLDDFRGRPVVVNLWATWCPPCRREMPALADAQARYSDAAIVFANQGEDAETVRRFLEKESLDLNNVLLDVNSRISAETGARGLPTTLFFDADGRLVDIHVGELTRAGLAEKMKSLPVKVP